MVKKLTKKRGHKAVKSHKNKMDERKRLNPGRIRSKELRDVYDKNKTWNQNMASIDLYKMMKDKLPASEAEIKTAHVPKIGEFEVPIVKKLKEKYGDDYAAMGRDRKINQWQWTVAKCEKLVSGFFAGEVKQRSEGAEIMSGRGIDLRKQIYGHDKKRNAFGH